MSRTTARRWEGPGVARAEDSGGLLPAVAEEVVGVARDPVARSVVTAVSLVPRALERSSRRLSRALSGSARPDPGRALASYRAVAGRYDLRTVVGEPYRRESVRALAAAPGAIVLDVGCGTGLNFQRLQEHVGPDGHVVGVDQSPDMLARARDRVVRHGWDNVTLIESAIEDVQLPERADAALLSATHDILRSPAAVETVVRSVRPGGRIVAAGAKWVPWWLPGSLPANFCVWQLNRSYVSTFEGFARPWSHLQRLIPDLEVRPLFPGAGYIAAGTRP